MLLLLVDGGLVDEHVVVVLVEDHKVVAEDHEVVAEDHEVVADCHEVVAEVEEKARSLFVMARRVCWFWCRSERCSLLRTPRSRLVANAQSRRVYRQIPKKKVPRDRGGGGGRVCNSIELCGSMGVHLCDENLGDSPPLDVLM